MGIQIISVKNIENSRTYPICVMIEPWGEDYTLLPGQTLCIELPYEGPFEPNILRRIKHEDDLVHVGFGAYPVQLTVSGEIVNCGYQREHCPLHGKS